MTDPPPPKLRQGGTDIDKPPRFPEGGVIRLDLTLGADEPRRLARATLRLAASPATTQAEDITPEATTDLGARPSGAKVRWVAADLGAERAITGIGLAGGKGAARVRLFSHGAWRPLPAPEPLLLAEGDAPRMSRFPAVAASRVMAELQAEMPSGEDKPPPALVPAPVAVRAMKVEGTGQPCHVAVAIGDDPPFFTLPAPLPDAPVEVAGLLRAANRFLAEAPPGTTVVPLRITAAVQGDTPLILLFDAAQAPPDPPPARGAGGRGTADGTSGSAGGSNAGPGILWPDPPPPEARARAWLCDATRAVAQPIESTPPGGLLLGLRLLLQPGTGTPPAGSIALHADADGAPQPAPIRGTALPFSAPPGTGPGWIELPLPVPLALPTGPLWAVFRLAAGEAFWFAADATTEFPAALLRPEGAGWRGDTRTPPLGRAQLRLRLATPEPA